MTTRVPPWLASRLAALVIGVGLAASGGYWASQTTAEALRDEYVQAVAADPATSAAVKVAMVMGSYYESSGKHIGTPYVDKLGKGQPLTVCNGITGPQVVQGRYYTPADCYRLERARYIAGERYLKAALPAWDSYTVWVQATALDFTHNKGAAAFDGSTMRRKLLAGDVTGACRENVRWNRGTVNGVSTVLPGLKVRADANAEICEGGLQ